MLVHRRVTPSSKFAGTHLYTWEERGTMGVKCLAQEHNAVPRPGLEPGPFDPESSALTIRPRRLQSNKLYLYYALWLIWETYTPRNQSDGLWRPCHTNLRSLEFASTLIWVLDDSLFLLSSFDLLLHFVGLFSVILYCKLSYNKNTRCCSHSCAMWPLNPLQGTKGTVTSWVCL